MIDRWPTPVPGRTLNLPLMGTVFHTFIPQQTSPISTAKHVPQINEICTSSENQVHTPIEEIYLFEVLQPVLSYIHMLWELVLTAEPLVVMASSPTYCSAMVLALTRFVLCRI